MVHMNINVARLARTALSIYRQVKRHQGSTRTDSPHRGTGGGGGGTGSELSKPYPGDFPGPVNAIYDPHPDGRADPGEIVWTWVPYEEDHSRGKDRPVLIVGRNGEHLLALMLTSKDRNNARTRDDDYVDIGSGSWDRQGRPSEVRVDRVIQVLEADLRREGAVLARDRFNAVVDRLQRA